MIPLDSNLLRNWFVECFAAAPYSESLVSTVGFEPYLEHDFDALLSLSGLAVHNIFDETSILILGAAGWDKEELLSLLDKREGKQLKVYSQEMFLAYWASGRDPLDDVNVARAFGEAHPALGFLSNVGFDWPNIIVNRSGSGKFAAESEKTGLLSYMGYRVGKTRGLPLNERREILEEIFGYNLPSADFSGQYMKEWGEPKSKERLEKMANSLASFCRNAKRRNNDVAVSNYEEDLEWLRENFYKGRFMFRWPQTYIG